MKIKVVDEVCDFYIPALSLFIWKFDTLNRPNYLDWGVGKKAGGGCFAVRTPWFLWYLQ